MFVLKKEFRKREQFSSKCPSNYSLRVGTTIGAVSKVLGNKKPLTQIKIAHDYAQKKSHPSTQKSQREQNRRAREQ